jgi:hypothetical protein
MKKNKLKFIAIFSVVSVLTFNSCEKIEEASPVTINTSKTATISGMVKANLVVDKTYIQDIYGLNSTGMITDTSEYAPLGTELHFHVDKSDYNSDVDGDEELIYSTTVNANGSYSITLPVTDEGVDVSISLNDFQYNKLTWKHDSVSTVNGVATDFYSSSAERKIFMSYGNSSEVHTSENTIIDFTYYN